MSILMQSKNPDMVQRINDLILPARRILLVTHVAPDGDAMGSLLGLGQLLREVGKEPIMACEDPVPAIYSWLPGSGDVVRQADGPHDLVISLDCSDRRRMGQLYHDPKMPTPVVNIDHHVTNTMFGTVNWVDPASVATAQMILSLADALAWELAEPVAVCLLTGLVTDTRSFRTSNVDSVAMRAALRLMEAGASISEITHRALEQRPLASIRLWGEAIEQLHLHGDVLWTEVTRTMRDHWGLDENGDSGLTNFLSSVREASVVIVFTERSDGTVDVGMRAVPGCDVAQVALKLGGGGHPQAAGCTMEGDLAMVRQLVLAEVQRGLIAQRKEP